MTVTLTAARRELGRRIGRYGVFTATGGSTTTLISASALLGSALPTDARAYSYVFVPGGTAPRQSRVTATGLDPATGTLTVDGAFGAAVANGTVFEVSPKLPPISDAEEMGPSLHDCLNQALQHLLVRHDIQRLLAPDTNDFSIAQDWLDRPERLLDVRTPNATGATALPSWRTWELREDAGGTVLHFSDPFRYSSGTYYATLVTLRPAHTWINDADSTVGFSAEADTADVQLQDLIDVALVFAFDALRKSRSGAATGRYQELYETQVGIARKARGYDRTNEIDASVPVDPAAVAVGAA